VIKSSSLGVKSLATRINWRSDLQQFTRKFTLDLSIVIRLIIISFAHIITPAYNLR